MSYRSRLSESAPYLNEAIRGRLPPVDILQLSLAERIWENQPSIDRLSEILEFVDAARQRTGAQTLPAKEMECPEQDILSLLYLDFLAYSAHSRLMDRSRKNGNGSSKQLKRLINFHRTSLVEARKTLLQDLLQFADIHGGAASDVRLAALKALSYDSGCAVVDQVDVRDEPIEEDLRGLLAEVKVLRGAQSLGWEASDFSSTERDINGGADVDIVLPDGKIVEPQVKSDNGANSRLRRGEYNGGELYKGLLIRVPTNERYDCFNLSEGDLAELQTIVLGRADELQALDQSSVRV